jgi:hypothetical protein
LTIPRQVEFTKSPKNYMRKKGTLEETMWAMAPHNSQWGCHASNDGETSICGIRGKWTNAETLKKGRPEDVATYVRCPFCQARPVNAGVLEPAIGVSPYARDYGTLPLQLP